MEGSGPCLAAVATPPQVVQRLDWEEEQRLRRRGGRAAAPPPWTVVRPVPDAPSLAGRGDDFDVTRRLGEVEVGWRHRLHGHRSRRRRCLAWRGGYPARGATPTGSRSAAGP
jgi:hypothetical protein